MAKTVLSNNIIGKEYPSIAYKVSKRRLIAFAKANEEVNPIYYEEQIAKDNSYTLISPVNLTKSERNWLRNSSKKDITRWVESIIKTSEKMLSQGLVKNLAKDQLRESALFQLSDLQGNKAAKTIGSKLISNVLHGKSNLRHDTGRSQQLLEELITIAVMMSDSFLSSKKTKGSSVSCFIPNLIFSFS